MACYLFPLTQPQVLSLHGCFRHALAQTASPTSRYCLDALARPCHVDGIRKSNNQWQKDGTYHSGLIFCFLAFATKCLGIRRTKVLCWRVISMKLRFEGRSEWLAEPQLASSYPSTSLDKAHASWKGRQNYLETWYAILQLKSTILQLKFALVNFVNSASNFSLILSRFQEDLDSRSLFHSDIRWFWLAFIVK